MQRRTKITLAAAIASGLVVAIALGAAGAIAASGLLSPGARSQAVIDDAAKQLGVEPSALSKALRDALKNRVDEAVDAGRLTEEQGARLKARIDSTEVPLFFGAFGHRGLHGPFGHVGPLAGLETAASYLGLTESELRERLADGDSLAEVAREEGKSVDGLIETLVDAAEVRIDEAVADGRLPEERASELKAHLKERVTALVERELPDRPFHPGFGFRHGPPPFLGPPA